MRVTRFLPVVALVLAGTAGAADDPKLEGTWEVVTYSKSGKVDEAWAGGVREHKGGKYTMTLPGGKKVTGTMKVDPEKQAIDLMPDDGQYKGKTLLGMYAFFGDDSLTIVFAEPGAARPTRVGPADGVTAVAYKRKK